MKSCSFELNIKSFMKKQLLTLLTFAAFNTFNAQLDSNSFTAIPPSGFTSAQYISTPITASLQFSTDFTLECWVMAPAFNGQEIHLIESYFGSGGGYVLRLSQTNRVKGYVMGASQPSTLGTTTLTSGVWNHVAVTYNTANGQLKVYVNGVLDGTTTPNIAIGTINSPVKIGARGDDSDVNNLAYMDEVRLWNTTRTEAELANNMNTCLVGNESGLVLYYDFENESGFTTATDKTANNNDGNINATVDPYGLGVFACEGQLNIENNTAKMKTIILSPNPTTSVLNINTNQLVVAAKIFDIRGRLMQSETTTSFSVSSLPAGIYILTISTENGIQSERFIKE